MRTFLLVTESIPFPPRNGRELPIAKFIAELTRFFKIDLLVISNDQKDFEDRRSQIPPEITCLERISFTRNGTIDMLLGEIFGSTPGFFSYNLDQQALKKLDPSYDIVWCSPVFAYQFVRACKALGMNPGKKIGIGTNDIIWDLYRDSFREVRSGRFGFHIPFMMDGLRAPFIKRQERKYLKEVDFVHLQTNRERNKLERLIPSAEKCPLSIVATNAIKQELTSAKAYDGSSVKVVMLAALTGGRSLESKWFVTKAWPQIHKKHPHLELHIIGKPADSNSWIHNTDASRQGIILRGFAESILDVFEDCFCLAVPILHSTGIINRALDGFAAGVPVIATPQVLDTVEGTNESNSIRAYSVEEYVKGFDLLVNDQNRALEIAKNGRKLVLKMPNWEECGKYIATQLNGLFDE